MAYTPTRRFAKLMFVFVTAAAVMVIGLHAGHAHGNALKAAKCALCSLLESGGAMALKRVAEIVKDVVWIEAIFSCWPPPQNLQGLLIAASHPRAPPRS